MEDEQAQVVEGQLVEPVEATPEPEVAQEEAPEPTPLETPLMAQIRKLLTAVALIDERQTAFSERLDAVEAGIAAHNHAITPEVVQHIANESKAQTIAHLREQIGSRLATFFIGNQL